MLIFISFHIFVILTIFYAKTVTYYSVLSSFLLNFIFGFMQLYDF